MKKQFKNLTKISKFPFLFSVLVSCSPNHVVSHGEFKKDEDLRFLYEVTYNDYSWDDVTTWMNSENHLNLNGSSFGCSSVHNGNFYGRSFDFCFTDMCEFVIRTPKSSDRFSSIGVAIGNCALTEDIISNNRISETNEKLLPFSMVDGINENGVVCNTNVVPAKDLIPHEGEETYFTHGTNPGKEDLFYQFMPRFVLDNATSADHAVELLKNRNLTAMNKKGEKCDYLGVSNMGYELHMMIADKNTNYIIEMVDDEMNIIKSGSNIMTNFYLSNMTPSGAGMERYSILFDNLSEGSTEEGMKRLIQRVQYSPCYRTDNITTGCPIWPTEFDGVSFVPHGDKIKFYNAEQECRKYWDDIKGALQEKYEETQDESKRYHAVGETVPWISTHAEVYDIENKVLNLVTQEEYSKWKKFKLND